MNRRGFFSLLTGAAAAPACLEKEPTREAAPFTARQTRDIDARGASRDFIEALPDILRKHEERILDAIRRGRLSLR